MIFSKLTYILWEIVLNLKGVDSDIFRLLEILIDLMFRIGLINDANIQKSSLTAFPRVTINKHLWHLQYLFCDIACLLFQFS